MYYVKTIHSSDHIATIQTNHNFKQYVCGPCMYETNLTYNLWVDLCDYTMNAWESVARASLCGQIVYLVQEIAVVCMTYEDLHIHPYVYLPHIFYG